MIAGLRPYPAYRDSGVTWLRHVPEHWRIAQTKRHYVIRLGKMLQPAPRSAGDRRVSYLKAKHVQWFAVHATDIGTMWASADEIDEYGVVAGDLLVCEGGEGGRCAVVGQDSGIPKRCIIQNALHRVRPRNRRSGADRSLNDYLQYVMHVIGSTGWLDVLSDKATIAHFTAEKFAALPTPIPPVPEQHAIVRFLEDADRRIRRTIAAKEKRVALLEEQKQAIIHRAVTGQIDVRRGEPYPAYKDSGTAQLGRIPQHWNVVRLGKLIALQTGFPFKSEGFTERAEDPRLLRGVNIAPGRLGWDDTVRWPATEADTARLCEYRLQTGDIVLGMDRPVIRGGTRVAVVTEADVPALLLQRVARIQPGPILRRDFAFLLLSGKPFADYMAPIFTGISVPHLSPEQIKGFTVALPGLGEQDQILKALAPAIRAAQRAEDRATRQIEHMKEYRTRLIADVVTGKLDVREASASLPDATNA